MPVRHLLSCRAGAGGAWSWHRLAPKALESLGSDLEPGL